MAREQAQIEQQSPPNTPEMEVEVEILTPPLTPVPLHQDSSSPPHPESPLPQTSPQVTPPPSRSTSPQRSPEIIRPDEINFPFQSLVPAKRLHPITQEEEQPPAQVRRMDSTSPGPSTRAQSQGKSDSVF